jgi:hypothetical protein
LLIYPVLVLVLLAAWAVAIRDLWQTEHAKPGSTADIGDGG